MWIASTLGFYSIVNKPFPDFQVRARERKDLHNLLEYMERTDWPVIKTPEGDYLWRIEIKAASLPAVFTALMGTIRYGNFKNAVHDCHTQQNKNAAYAQVWRIMGDIQPGGPYGLKHRRPFADTPQWRDGETWEQIQAPTWAAATKPSPIKAGAPSTWRYRRADKTLHAVANASTGTRHYGSTVRGAAICGAEETDWLHPVPPRAKRCMYCELMRVEATKEQQ